MWFVLALVSIECIWPFRVYVCVCLCNGKSSSTTDFCIQNMSFIQNEILRCLLVAAIVRYDNHWIDKRQIVLYDISLRQMSVIINGWNYYLSLDVVRYEVSSQCNRNSDLSTNYGISAIVATAVHLLPPRSLRYFSYLKIVWLRSHRRNLWLFYYCNDVDLTWRDEIRTKNNRSNTGLLTKTHNELE